MGKKIKYLNDAGILSFHCELWENGRILYVITCDYTKDSGVIGTGFSFTEAVSDFEKNIKEYQKEKILYSAQIGKGSRSVSTVRMKK
jgi:hypothetical protein